MTKQPLAVGDRVQLTGKHVRNTGQYTGRAPASVWTITGFSGSFVVTDERLPESLVHSMWTAAELSTDPTLAFRRFAPGNLQRVRR